MLKIRALETSPLSVPLREPFIIATGRMDATRALLVRVTLDDGSVGIGEAAAFPPVTEEDPSSMTTAIGAVAPFVVGMNVAPWTLTEDLAALLPDHPVSRAGIEGAILDAMARNKRTSVRAVLGGDPLPFSLVSDVTIPILPLETMCDLAAAWNGRGFEVFKIKVGRDVDADLVALRAMQKRVPTARFRIDANGGFSAEDALRMTREAREMSLVVECFEQPCAREDKDGMAKVTRESGVDVVADESVKTLAELEEVIARKMATGVNLKLAKSGGLLGAAAIGRRAKSEGLSVMIGGMVETRLGMTAAAHVAAALGGVDYVDLDTAMLLAEDPFDGGYGAEGPRLTLAGEGDDALGFGVRLRAHPRPVRL